MTHILIMGAGGMGLKHAQAFASLGCQVSCLDTNPDKKPHFENLHISSFFSKLSDVPAQSFDAAVIATPAHTHVALAEWAIEQRLPFLLEKPLAVTEDGISQLVQRVKQDKLPCAVAFPRRHSRYAQTIQRWIHQERLGKTRMWQSQFSQDFRKYRPDFASTYYATRSTGGGILLDALSHHLNLACLIMGPVSSVHCFASRAEFHTCEGEDHAVLNLTFSSGSLGQILGNQFQKPNVDQLEVVGTDGNLRYDRILGEMTFNTTDSTPWGLEKIDGDWIAILHQQATDFLALLDGKKGAGTTLSEAWQQLRVLLAAETSIRTGRAIRVDPCAL